MNSNTLNLIIDLFKEYPNIHSCHISSSVVQDKEGREICVISLNKINGSPLNLTSSYYISILNKSNRNFDQLLFDQYPEIRSCNMFGKNHTSNGKIGFTIWLRNLNSSEIRLVTSSVNYSHQAYANIHHEDINVVEEEVLSTELLEANLKISSLNKIVSLLNKEILNNPIEFETYEYTK